jgi:4-amino-4-deoxy-L-arabinose transferase-like glycosyltransferase
MPRIGRLTETSVQSAVYAIELGRGKRIVQWSLIVVLAIVLGMVYTATEFNWMVKREALDMAQLARNIARGEGFTTHVLRPLSLWHMKTYSPERNAHFAKHPDLYNPPLYPLVLAGLFKLLPESALVLKENDRIFGVERWVIIQFNQACLLLTVLLVFVWAQKLFDRRVAITSAVLLLLSDTMWGFGISGLPTNLLMLLWLGSLYCLFLVDRRLNPEIPPAEELPTEIPRTRKLGLANIALLVLSAVLMGLAFLTRYLSGFFLVPMIFYLLRIVWRRRAPIWVVMYVAVFLAVIAPWLARNYMVSRSVLGIAKYDIIQGTGRFPGDALARSYRPEINYSVRAVLSKTATSLRNHIVNSIKQIGTDYLVFFFGVGCMYAFRRRNTSRLRWLVLGSLLFAFLAMSMIGSPGERIGPEIHGGNLLILFLPFVMIYGTAFFYLLLDRIHFRIRLTRAAAIGAFIFINILPLILTLLPPRKGPFPYPPLVPPVTRIVAAWFQPGEAGVSDMPWAMAWDGDRRCLWLPMTMDEFTDIHDFVAPRTKDIAFLMLTPFMLDRPFQTEIAKGEFRGWVMVMRGQLPTMFPLKAVIMLPPGNDQILLADRPRWEEGTTTEPGAPMVPGEPPSAASPEAKPAG